MKKLLQHSQDLKLKRHPKMNALAEFCTTRIVKEPRENEQIIR